MNNKFSLYFVSMHVMTLSIVVAASEGAESFALTKALR